MSVKQALAEAEMKHLDADSQRLRNQLAKNDERKSRLRIYIDLDQEFVAAESKQETDGLASTAASAPDMPNGKMLTRRIVDAAIDFIRSERRPTQTRDLLPQMAQLGLPIGGKNPVANLSGYLCRDKKRLVNNRRLGWRLVEWGGDTPHNDPPKSSSMG